MRHLVLACSTGAILLAAGSMLACGGADEGTATDNVFQDKEPTLPASDAGKAPSFGDVPDAGSEESDAGPGKVLFYAHSDTTVYELDPENMAQAPVELGDFGCVGPGKDTSVMTDLAVDKLGNLFGVSPTAAWPLQLEGNGGGAACMAKWTLPYNTHFNGLTMAPEKTIADQEVLIGGNAVGELHRIDSASGTSTVVGTLGTDTKTGRPWTVSGDMVFMANNGDPIGFATARTCTTTTNCEYTDTLIELDVKAIKPGTQSVLKAVRGPIVRGAWCNNPSSPQSFGSIFGIVAYQDRVFGFSRKGDIIEIHNDDGSACLVRSEPTIKWAGAGITTVAPVKKPPAKPR